MRKVSRRGVAAGRAEGKSLCARLAPSSKAQGSNGIQRPSGVLEWTSKSVSSGFEAPGTSSGRRKVDEVCGNRRWMERHIVTMVGEQGEVLCRSSPFGEDASGYAHLFELLGSPEGCLAESC